MLPGAPSCIQARRQTRDQDVKAKGPRILKGSRGLACSGGEARSPDLTIMSR